MISRAKTKVQSAFSNKKKPSAVAEPNLDDMIARRDYTGAIAVLEVGIVMSVYWANIDLTNFLYQ